MLPSRASHREDTPVTKGRKCIDAWRHVAGQEFGFPGCPGRPSFPPPPPGTTYRCAPPPPEGNFSPPSTFRCAPPPDSNFLLPPQEGPTQGGPPLSWVNQGPPRQGPPVSGTSLPPSLSLTVLVYRLCICRTYVYQYLSL